MAPTHDLLAREWRALPLVSRAAAIAADASDAPSNPPELQIDADALAALRRLRARTVHVLGLFGPPRSHKRLFLRTLLRSSCDFTVPATPDRSVLLWLWLPTHATDTSARDSSSSSSSSNDDAENIKLVISSGARANETPTDRKQRLALLLLLSSALVYNDDGEINAQAIERLDWLADVAQVLRVKPNQDETGVATDFRQHAPKLIWLIQNVKLKWLTGDDGGKLTPLQYLERALADESGYSDAVAQRNANRMYLHAYFPVRECVALSRALESVSAVASPTTERDALRQPFVDAIDAFYATYLSQKASAATALPAKQLMGAALRAEQLALVLETYVQSLNRAALPTIALASSALLQHTITDGFTNATRVYDTAMAAVATSLETERQALSPHALYLAHARGVQSAEIGLQDLATQLPESLRKSTFHNRLAEWRAYTKSTLAARTQQNELLSTESCDALLAELLPHNLEAVASDLASKPRASFSDGLTTLLSQYKSDLRQATDAYAARASGPRADSALAHALETTVLTSITHWSDLVLAQYRSHMDALESERSDLERTCDAARVTSTYTATSSADQTRQYDAQLAAATQELSALRARLRGELNAKTAALERLRTDLDMMARKQEVRVQNAMNDIAWSRSRTAELERAAFIEHSHDGSDAEDARSSSDGSATAQAILTKERSLHDEERSLLTQQRDLMDRVAHLEHAIAQAKSAHLHDVFARENALARMADDRKTEHAEFARQLKTQAKTDTGVLKLAFAKTRASVERETEAAACEAERLRAQLADLSSPVNRESAKTSERNRAFFSAMALPMPAVPVFPPDADASGEHSAKASRRAASFMDVSTTSATLGPNTATRVAASRTDSAICKQS